MSPTDPTPEQPDPAQVPPTPPPAGDYTAPPPPQQGYGTPPPAAGQSPLPVPTMEGFPPAQQQDETIWALLAHLSYFVLSLIGPLIIMLVCGDQRPYARAHAVEALNFHITVWIGLIASFILMFVIIGFFTFFAIIIAGVIFSIMAAIKASQGEGYRYPLTLRLVK